MQMHKHLSVIEQEKIREYRKQGLSYRQITKAINVSLTQVSKLLQKKSFNKRKETRGGKIAFTQREDRGMKKLATKQIFSSTEIKATLGIRASTRTIQRHLKHDMVLKFGKFYSKPKLMETHKNRVLNGP